MKKLNKLLAAILGFALIGSLFLGLGGTKKAAAEGETPAKNVNAELKFGEETWLPTETGHDYVENTQWFLHHSNYFTIDGRLNFNSATEPAGLNSKTVYNGNYILEFDLYGTNALGVLVLVIHGSENLPSIYKEPYFMFIESGKISMPGQTAAKVEDFSAIPNWAAGSGVRLRFVVLEKSIIVYCADVTETGVGEYVRLVTFSNLTPFSGAAARTSGTIRLLGHDGAHTSCSIDNLSVTTLVDNDETVKENFDNDQYDETKWKISNNGKSGSFAQGDAKVKGLVVDNGTLAFAGTKNNCCLDSLVARRNFVFSFDYITTARADRPVLNTDDVTTDYSWCGVWFARPSAVDAYTGKGILLQDHQASMAGSSKKNESMQDLYPNWGKTATHRVTVIVRNGDVILYIAEKNADGTYGAESAVCEWKVTGETYGYVGITSDNAGYWHVDNISYTALPQTGEMPVLSTPKRVSVKTRENGEPYLRWNPVDWATAYEVTVGEETPVVVDKNEFEIKDLAAGNYAIKIVAKGDEDAFVGSKAAEFTYEAVSVTVKDGDEVLSAVTCPKGQKVTLVAPEKAGYEFKGFYSDAAFETPFDQSVALEESVTVYAKFEKVTTPDSSSGSDSGKPADSVSSADPGSSGNSSGSEGGCFGGIGSLAGVSVMLALAAGAVIVFKRKAND